MKSKLIGTVLALTLGAGYSLNALSQSKPKVMVEQREAAMLLMAKYLGPMVGMARGKAPFDAKVVKRNASYLAVLSQMPWDGFDPSTSSEESHAKSEIYVDTAKFKEHQERLHREIRQLVAAANGGNEGHMKQAIGAVGKACGSCHDDFRKKKE